MAPDAAASLLALDKSVGGLVYTDIFRDARSQLLAYKAKPILTQPPGKSAHGFGLAVDLDLSATLSSLMIGYHELADKMVSFGWYCHRRDDKGPFDTESWHFNFLGPDPAPYLSLATSDRKTWSKPVEQRIQERYGDAFVLSERQIINTLNSLSLLGEESPSPSQLKRAILAFQINWGLEPDGVAGPKTQRLLAYVTALKSIEPIPCQGGIA